MVTIVTILAKWTVEVSDEAAEQFEALVPPKFRTKLMRAAIKALSENPDVASKARKILSPDRKPFFPGRVVWQLSIQDFRFFYEIIEDTVVLVFFVGRKGKGTTRDMVNRS